MGNNDSNNIIIDLFNLIRLLLILNKATNFIRLLLILNKATNPIRLLVLFIVIKLLIRHFCGLERIFKVINLISSRLMF